MSIRSLTLRLQERAASVVPAVLVVAVAAMSMGAAASGGDGRVDRSAPSAPGAIEVVAQTRSSVELRWSDSHDNVDVAGYGIYVGSSLLAVTDPTKAPFATSHDARELLSGFTCGASYAVAIDAYDAAGNRSKRTTAVVASGECVDNEPPTAPSGVRQIANTDTAATIAWDRSSDNVLVVGYRLFLGPVSVGTTQTTSFTFAGLSCGATSEVGVEAYDVSGNGSSRSRFFVTTRTCPDSNPPSQPSGLRQTGSSVATVTVAWSPSSDDVAVTGYEVSVGNVVSARVTGTSHRVDGLSCGSSYSMSIVALDAAANRSKPASLVARTSACVAPPPGDTQPPSVPAALTIASAAQTSISLTWQPSTDNVGIEGYGLYRGGALLGTTSSSGYTFGSLTCGSSYQLGVDAVDSAGNRSPVAQVVAATAACSGPPPPPDAVAPSVPGNAVSLGDTETSITISWAASTDNVGVAGYQLFLSGAPIGTTTQTSYTYSGLECGSSYVLGVYAFDAAGNHSDQAIVASNTAACPDVNGPAAPGALTASNVTKTSATLSWSASPGVAGYGVYIDGANAGQTTSTSYTFGTLSCGNTFTLAVDAYDLAGNRSAKSAKAVTTSACSVTLPPPSGNLAMSASGSDSTCVRGDSTKPCSSFQRAYDLAQPGDTISVAAGTYPANDLGRDAVTIFGGTKQVTFVCQDSSSTVTTSAFDFTIKAHNVTVRGGCFRFRNVNVGEGGDNPSQCTVAVSGRCASNVTIDGIHMDGLEVVGGQATIRNSEVGPSTLCWGQGQNQPAAEKCDPSNPIEAFYAGKPEGSSRLDNQVYFHNNSGGVISQVVFENNYVHDIQTKDAVELHTGCGIVWQDGGALGTITFRNNRFERCAVLGIIFRNADGVLMEGNTFGPVMEPFSNTGGALVEAGDFAKDIVLRAGESSAQNWLVTGNMLCHGHRSEIVADSSVRFEANDLGRANDPPWPGATFTGNTNVGVGC